MHTSNQQLKIIEQNHLGHFMFLPKNLTFDVLEINGVTVINCGLQTSMFNIAYGSPKSIGTSFPIREIKQVFQDQPFAWWIPPSQYNQRITENLLNNGFIIETIEHAMICNLNNMSDFTQKTSLELKHVTTSSLLQDFIKVIEPYDPQARYFYEKINASLLRAAEKLIVGYAYNKPVAIGILFTCGNSAGIFSVITKINERGKGYGSDMMCFLMKIAKNYNCHAVTLSASSTAGYYLYERLGFTKIGEFECFEYKGN